MERTRDLFTYLIYLEEDEYLTNLELNELDWNRVLRELEENPEVSPISYDVFIKKLKPIAFDKRDLIIECSSSLVMEIVESKYKVKLEMAVIKMMDCFISIRLRNSSE